MRDARYFVVEGRLYLLTQGSVYEWTRRDDGSGWAACAMPTPAFVVGDEREIPVQEATRLQRRA